jgi:hypothetical protein
VRIPIHRLLFRPTLSHRGKHAGRKGALGYCDKRARVIELDPRQPHMARTFLHELLHLAHPQWSEARVQRVERERWARLTWKDKARLYQAIGRGVYE